MAAPATWSGWLAGLWSSLWGAPAAGSPEAELEEKRVGALLEKESAKPEGQQDGERIRQLDVQYTKLMLANLQADARQLAIDVSMLESPATGRDCCAASDWVRSRTAASSRAVLDYFQQCIVQLTEQLAAEETGRPIEVVVQPTLRLDLPEALQQQPPWLDVCSVCASEMKQVGDGAGESRVINIALHSWACMKLVGQASCSCSSSTSLHASQIEVDEEACRVHMQHLPEDLRAEGRQGIPAAAATSPGEAGATAAAADLPAQQAQQQQQQQKCGGARDAGSADGAPTTPTEQPAVLRLRQHGSSDREQEQQDAADEQCLLPREARCQQLEPR